MASILGSEAWAKGTSHAIIRWPRALSLTTVLTLVLVLFSLPRAGGAQCSARFFLPAAPFVAVLAVERLRDVRTRGLTALLVAASLALQMCGMGFLRQSKRVNAQITRTAASLTQPGDVIVSDLFWYPEATATLYPSRRMLFAPSPAAFDAIAAAAAERGFPGFWIATATEITGYAPPPTFAAGYVRTRVRDAGLSSLAFYQYERKWKAKRTTEAQSSQRRTEKIFSATANTK